MNDLYKVLARQAADTCEERAEGGAWLWEEEFARLIVEHCVNIVDSFDSCETSHISYAIKNDFGMLND